MTEERLSVEVLIHGLKTKSDKIRKLADSGYSRAEIGKALGIRYQHVRNVLIAVRKTRGLRHPNGASQSPMPVRQTPSGLLVQAGFQQVGDWTQTGGGITPSGRAPMEPGVYAFALDGIVVYVGSTSGSLQDCMYQYRRGDTRQKTRARINGLIKTSLASGRHLEILVATPHPSEWNGLPVSTSAGLEVGLIQMIRPAWNIKG